MNKHLIQINEVFKYKINITYPITKYIKINKIITEMISNILNEFISISKRNKQLNFYYTLYITYDTYMYKNLTQYIFKISEFTGGAHPNNYIKTFRFYKDNIINIDDLVNNDKNILSKLSENTRKIFLSKDMFKDNSLISMVLDGTRPNKSNFKNFIFTNNGLLILFDYYQVAPYYLGIQKVIIPYNKLL